MSDDLVSPLRIVLRDDPALDLERMNLRAYLNDRDPARVVTIAGKQPRWFTLRALDVFEVAMVKSHPSVYGQLIPAIQRGLAAVDADVGDEALRPKKEIEGSFGKLISVWPPEDVDKLFHRFGMNALLEIGMVIIERAELGNVKSGSGGGARFSLPPQSEPALAQNERLRAELTRKQSETQNKG